MLEKSGDQSLVFLDFLLILGLLHLELFSKLVNLLFLLIENFVLLLLAALSILFSQVLVNFLNILLVSTHHIFHLYDFLIDLLNLCIVLLDAVLEPLSGLWERQVHLIGLELQILLLLGEHGPLLLQVLSSLLQGILPEPGLGLGKSSINVLQLISRVVDILRKHVVLFFQFLVLIPLLWIQVVESRLVLEVDFLDLALVRLDFSLHIPLLSKEVVEVRPLLVVLTLDVHEESLDILWLGVTSILIKRQVVVGQLALVSPDILDESLVLSL